MNPLFTRSLLLASLALAGCDRLPSLAGAASPSLALSPWGASAKVKAEDLRFVPGELSAGTDLRIAASERNGLLLVDPDGQELARLPGSYSGLDSRSAGRRL
ncbi:MAG TPA: 3-phytase, partial [Pseudomonas sp.]|nr:3-phytase [Pseudomonas sp.]